MRIFSALYILAPRTVDGNVYDAYIDERDKALEDYTREKLKGKNVGLVQTE